MKSFLSILFLFLMWVNSSAQFPGSYDLRSYGYVTSVKDQGSCGACWAFATCAAIESSYLVQGGSTIDLSEDNLNDCHSFNEAPCTGGSFYMAQALMSMHQGIYSEAQDPYTPSTVNCILGGPFPPSPWGFVEEIRFLPGNVNDIKQALMTYGAVATTMFMNYNDPTVWDGVNFKYYDASISSTDSAYAHSVTIVGWDDSYTFPGAPGNGGWIIKDSYGTSWANSGYFYCSYFDSGILCENAVFPTIRNLPGSGNTPVVYAYDELGWVDNYGFGTTTGYAAAKFTITPFAGIGLPQKIMRVGAYAVDTSITINIKLYRSFNGTSFSDLIDEKTISSTQYAGFYTADLNLKTDTILSEIYVVAEYISSGGNNNPIPIEISETGHTSNNFTPSNGTCWISANGSTWTQVGNGTSFVFDPCIKMYTEMSVYADISADVGNQACVGTMVNLTDASIGTADSSVWIIDGVPYWNMPVMNHMLATPGNTNIQLIEYFGDHTDTANYAIMVYDYPAINVTQSWNTLIATQSGANYQWLDCDNNYAVIPGETGQNFTPTVDGNYAVEINLNGCIDTSSCTNVIIGIEENEFGSKIAVFPNPTRNFVEVELNNSCAKLHVRVLTALGVEIQISEILNTAKFRIDLPEIPGVYFVEIANENGEKAVLKVVKE